MSDVLNFHQARGDLIIEDVFVASNEDFYRIPSIALTRHGDILAFANRRRYTAADSAEEVHLVSRRWNRQSGRWEKIEDLFARADWNTAIGTALLDESTNRVIVSYHRKPVGGHPAPNDPTPGPFVITSDDNGQTWQHETLTTHPNSMKRWGFSHGGGPGITLRFGPRKGRLIAPARFAIKPSEDIETLQQYHYNCAIYSDDGGRIWHTSEPVQVGTGEGCLAELSDGRIYYNSRAYFLDGRRRIAWSYDGGETFEDFSTDTTLNEPLQGGCNASLVRVPGTGPEEKDLLLFCNPADTTRKRLTVRVSRDGGRTWTQETQCIYEGPSAYCSMAASKDGIIYILFENGISSPYEKISIARFSLSGLLS